MKKTFGFYAIIWAIFLLLFNVTVFVIPHFTTFGGAFWVGYIFITLAFIGQLICAFFAFIADSKQKLFYNIPLITLSYSGLIAMLSAGAVCMKTPFIPDWLGIILCFTVLAFNAVAVIKALYVSTAVSGIDEKVKEKTYFMKNLTLDALHLYTTCNNESLKPMAKNVYEAVRYSDPMSSEALFNEENDIQVSFSEFKDAILKEDMVSAEKKASKVLADINKRNEKCKLLK